MTVKPIRFLSILASAAISIGFFASCDDISENERLLPVGTTEAQRSVLLEEFTGQRCTNCPDGHEAVHEILKIYPENAIPVCIHASSLSINEPSGLANDEGAEYYKAQNNPALPAGVINRATGTLTSDTWMTKVSEVIGIPTTLIIDLKAELDDAGENIKVTTNLTAGENISGNLQLWVVEDGIVARQLDHGTMKTDYVHDHVFRGTVNGLWGEPINIAALSAPEKREYTVAVKNIWNPDNLTIVGFIYNDGGVVNAAKVNVEK